MLEESIGIAGCFGAYESGSEGDSQRMSILGLANDSHRQSERRKSWEHATPLVLLVHWQRRKI